MLLSRIVQWWRRRWAKNRPVPPSPLDWGEEHRKWLEDKKQSMMANIHQHDALATTTTEHDQWEYCRCELGSWLRLSAAMLLGPGWRIHIKPLEEIEKRKWGDLSRNHTT